MPENAEELAGRIRQVPPIALISMVAGVANSYDVDRHGYAFLVAAQIALATYVDNTDELPSVDELDELDWLDADLFVGGGEQEIWQAYAGLHAWKHPGSRHESLTTEGARNVLDQIARQVCRVLIEYVSQATAHA